MRISAGEKALWDDDVKVFWQKKAWVDKHVMKDLAIRFVDHKKKVHGEDLWVILFCDNLSAHLDDDVREIFGNGKVFLCFFPPNMTNFIQPIDAGLGRSVRIKIGHYLDEWLMDADNMERWESKMTASERRVLTTIFISKSLKDIMSVEYDGMRIKSFERTGCLLTWLPNDVHDGKICPQGLVREMFQVPKVRTAVELEESNLPEPMAPEQAAIAEEQVIIDENEGEGNLDLEEEDDGAIIDDNPEI